MDEWPNNVWIGATAEDQRRADTRLAHLSDIPATIRFLSCEPLLGNLDLNSWLADNAIQWVIAGGESGPHARPSDPIWFLNLLKQCQQNGVPFHFKQWGEWAPLTASDTVPRSILDDGTFSEPLARFGKKASGRELNGQPWDGAPLTGI